MDLDTNVDNQDESENNFELQKRQFFQHISLSLKSALLIHKDQLWESNTYSKRDRDNVTKHCLVEVARCDEFSDLLGFSPGVKQTLRKAAMLHDVFKRQEKDIVSNKEKYTVPTREAFEESLKHEDKILETYKEHDRKNKEQGAKETYGISASVSYLLGSVGHSSLEQTRKILEKSKHEELDELEKAFLVLHYVDDYTVGEDWASPAKIEHEVYVNDVDDRMQKNKDHPRYKQLDTDGVERFGKSTFDEQHDLGKQVESYLLEIIKGDAYTQLTDGEKASLPYDIDQKIIAHIAKEVLTSKKNIK